MKLIAFTGPAGCGKDTAARHLERNHGFVSVSFAHSMKHGLKEMMGLTEAHVNGHLKEAVIPELGKSPRQMLQTLGTDWGRKMIDLDIWIYPVARAWEDLKANTDDTFHSGMVISDLRFENEARWVRDQGGTVIHLECPDLEKIDSSEHSSESGVKMHPSDGEIINRKSLGEFRFHELLDNAVECLTEPDPATGIAELQEEISSWADGVFPDRTAEDAIRKLMWEELPELMLSGAKDPKEFADVVILVLDIAHLQGIDVASAIRDKMLINRARKWAIDPKTGLMNHVEITNG